MKTCESVLDTQQPVLLIYANHWLRWFPGVVPLFAGVSILPLETE